MNPYGTNAEAAVHVQEAMSLEADGYVELFSIHMQPVGQAEVKAYLSTKNTVSWRGYTWESYAVSLTDYKKDATGEMSRPKMSLANPNGIFSRYAHKRWLEGAEIRRYRVLKQHLDANVNSFLVNYWTVGKIANLSRTLIVMELRGVVDGQSFTLPARAYLPPDFPSVSV